MCTSEAAVAVISLGHDVGNRSLFRGLDLTAHAGEVHAIVGSSGAGKSTLLRMLGGLERPGSGTIRAFDQEVTRLRGSALRRYLRDRVGFVFQNAGLVEQWTVRKHLAVAASAVPRNPLSAPVGLVAAADRVDVPRALLDQRVAALSGGERQRVAIASLLVRKPSLVLLDEPTAALDPVNTGLVVGILREFAEDGAAVIVASHDPGVLRTADAETRLPESASN